MTSGTWGSDAPAVVTVGASTGVVTAVGPGEVTIFVDAQGVRGTRRTLVVPRYNGIWFGQYRVTSCTATGAFIDAAICEDTLKVGNVLSAGLNFQQNGPVISGQTLLGSLFSQSVTANVGVPGGLSFAVNAIFPSLATQVAQQWDLALPTDGALQGTLVQTWTDPVLTGNLVAQTVLEGWALSADALPAAAADAHMATLKDVAAAIARKR
ncbi:MAG: hypothetical protein AMXMBFR57_17100 [Acidimicrobiia bacterium]